MASPRGLTLRYVDAYNRRDHAAMRALLSPTIEFIRPGPTTLHSADEVMAQYEREWAGFQRSRVNVRELMEAGDAILAEITVTGTMGATTASVEGVIAHRWLDGRMVRYRAYFDPMHAEAQTITTPGRSR